MASPALRVGGAAAAALATASIAAAVQLASPLTEAHEGYRGKVYLDPAQIPTQCFGETEHIDPSRIYSREECAVKLRARMAKDYAPHIARCMPLLVGPDWPKYTSVFAAALDASYNTGPLPVCKRMGPLVNAGKLTEACDSLPGWYTTAKNRVTGVRKVFPGLVRRRKEEQALCKRGLKPAAVSSISDAMPPERFRGSATATVFFVPPTEVAGRCNLTAPPGYRIFACANGRDGAGVMVLTDPTPYALEGEFYARIVAHEIAHLHGWNHER